MTLLTWIPFVPQKLQHMRAPLEFSCADVSVIVPVKNNQRGIERFLDALTASHDGDSLPHEVVIVDNASSPAFNLPGRFARWGAPMRVVNCPKGGPASARNAGCTESTGKWFLFSDSDCVPTRTFLSGYTPAVNGSVAYAGYVQSDGSDRLSRYYESQEILIPPRVHDDQPQYLITANALVWREAFEAVGGFDEAFPLAGGEDVDLGFRLSQVGRISYAPASLVRHDFTDGYRGFLRRFVRYGRGNRRVAQRYDIDLRPRVFRPAVRTGHNWAAAIAQFVCMSWGYYTEKLAPDARSQDVCR